MHLFSRVAFDKGALSDHIRVLASDAFDGRAPMTEGEEMTLSYLEREFTRLGVKRLPRQDSFRQAVSLTRIRTTIDGPITISGCSLAHHEEIVVASELRVENLSLDEVPMIFVGYGIRAPEFDWDDYKNIDVTNKIVVTLVNDPGFVSPTLFRGKDTTYYGRWTYKFEEARRQGALGALVIHETEPAGYGFHLVQHKGEQLVLKDQNRGLLIQGWLHAAAAQKIFARKDLDFTQLKQRALTAGAAQANVGALTLKAKNMITEGQSHNICGVIEGMKTNEYVALSAHWDHLGSKINTKGAKEIYRGAIDNATGVAALLELARYFSQNKPQKNVLLCSFTAEEQGLMGAKRFVERPPVPLHSIKGMLNFDCLNPGERTNSVIIYGSRDNALYPLLYEAVKAQGRTILNDPNSAKGYFYRSDHYPFVQQDVAALLFMDLGVTNPDYLHHHYHQPSDVYDPNWKLDGLIQDLELFKVLVERI